MQRRRATLLLIWVCLWAQAGAASAYESKIDAQGKGVQQNKSQGLVPSASQLPHTIRNQTAVGGAVVKPITVNTRPLALYAQPQAGFPVITTAPLILRAEPRK